MGPRARASRPSCTACGARHAECGRHLRRRPGGQPARRSRADPAPARPHRLRLPVLQPRPTLTARENILLPVDLAGAKVDETGSTSSSASSASVTASRTARPRCRGPTAAGGVCPGPHPRPDLVFADEPPQPRLERRRRDARLLAALGARARQSIVMVTHDPRGAPTPARGLSGRRHDRGDMSDPTAESVLEQMKQLGT